jgi:hypothetical protein
MLAAPIKSSNFGLSEGKDYKLPQNIAEYSVYQIYWKQTFSPDAQILPMK